MKSLPVHPRAQHTIIAVAILVLGGYRIASHIPLFAQAGPRTTATPQKLDEEYTARIKKATPDARILTDLVDHMPASATVPSPLKFLGYVPGEPGQLTYHKDIVRYYEALEKASPRVKLFRIGKSEEGRDMVALAIADEATIKQLDKYKQITARLTDPRKLTDAEAKQLIATGKPIYYATGSIHSPELGSPEMLTELAFRLAVEESPFIQTIRNNSIVVITPATEVDGREKAVDNFKFAQQNPGKPAPGLVYWGQYVQHDNNRDASASAEADAEHPQELPRLGIRRYPRLHETADAALCLDRHRPVQHRCRSDPGQRVVAPRPDGDDGAGEAERPRRVDLQLLRRLGPELHVLDRRHAQLDRPLLRDPELPRAELCRRRQSEPRVVPPEPHAQRHHVGAARQREHPAERHPDLDEQPRQQPRDLPRELLPEEQAHDRARPGEGPLRLRHPRGQRRKSKRRS